MSLNNQYKKLIVFEGSDACGKSYTASAVKIKLEKKGYKVKLLHFPNYNGEGVDENEEIFYGKEIYKKLRDKEFDIRTNLTHAIQMGTMQMKDKLQTRPYITKLLEEYDFVILDRFLTSRIVYDRAAFDCVIEFTQSDMNTVSHMLRWGNNDYLQCEIESHKWYKELKPNMKTIGFLRNQNRLFMGSIIPKDKRDNDNNDLAGENFTTKVDNHYLNEFLKLKDDEIFMVDCDKTLFNKVVHYHHDNTVEFDINKIHNIVAEHIQDHIIQFIES